MPLAADAGFNVRQHGQQVRLHCAGQDLVPHIIEVFVLPSQADDACHSGL